MYFHVLIELNEKHPNSSHHVAIYELDIPSLDQMEHEIVMPYLKAEPFYFDGHPISSKDVWRIKIFSSTVETSQYEAKEEARLRQKRIASIVSKHDMLYTEEYVKDITKEILARSKKVVNSMPVETTSKTPAENNQHDELTMLVDLLNELKYLKIESGNVLEKTKYINGTTRFLIRNIWGEQSAYIKELDRIKFNLPTSFDPNYITDASFNSGKESLTGLLNVVIKHIEYSRSKKALKPQDQEIRKLDLDKVFIVHGQDDLAKIEAARFIENLGFKPIILHEQVSEGKTIIEKIEAHSNVGFGIILYTPCDIGAIKGKEGHLQARARQNVVFEHGYLIGKLGRNKVCALVKDEVEKPNDISGVVYIKMDAHEGWHKKVAKEMKACGYEVDLNKL